MEILVANNGDKHDTSFVEPVCNWLGNVAEVELVHYTQIPRRRTIENSFGAFAMSGVSLAYTSDDMLARLRYYRWVRNTKTPGIGVCGGDQLLGKLFGGEILRDTGSEHGLVDTRQMAADPLFTAVPKSFESHSTHRDSVTVPPDFKLLARSAHCGNLIMRHESRLLYGFQAHPELSPDYIPMLNNFVALAAEAWEARQPSATVIDLAQQLLPHVPMSEVTEPAF